ncbi:MAG: hypothetical protein OIF47_01810 [Marinibacterium sp.]|nr:hypothetical protein [Marinibacterium sp.]
MKRMIRGALIALCGWAGMAQADDGCDAQCQIARKVQDPLANIRAVITDNTIGFDDERDPLAYGFQVQPVYSLPTTGDYNVILRGIVPIVGARNGVVLPPLGGGPRGSAQYDWGLGDVVLQAFVSPRGSGGIKFGLGPQISLRTRTNDAAAGPGWGGGLTAVVTGASGRWTYGGIVGQHWGQDGFSVASINPVLMYNSDLFGGSYLGYANTMTYTWDAPGSERWQVPVGVTFGKTFPRADGSAIDVNIGAYSLAARPDGAAKSQLKFGLSLVWP